MKKSIMLPLLIFVIVGLLALPAAAGLEDIDEVQGYIAVSLWPTANDVYESRFDLIDENAFRGTTGINVVQMSTGNGNILQDNKDITALAEASDEDLMITAAVSVGSWSGEYYDTRFDKISGNAFRGSVGLNTVQMSSGNGNILQSSLSLQVGPGVAQNIGCNENGGSSTPPCPRE